MFNLGVRNFPFISTLLAVLYVYPYITTPLRDYFVFFVFTESYKKELIQFQSTERSRASFPIDKNYCTAVVQTFL